MTRDRGEIRCTIQYRSALHITVESVSLCGHTPRGDTRLSVLPVYKRTEGMVLCNRTRNPAGNTGQVSVHEVKANRVPGPRDRDQVTSGQNASGL